MTLIEGVRATIPLLIVMVPLMVTGARLVVAVMIIMIVVIAMIVVIVMMMMVVFVAIVKQIGTHKIDAQTEERDRDRFAIGDRNRINEPHYGFAANEQRDHRENYGAGKGRKVADFSGTEGEPVITDVTACIILADRVETRAPLRPPRTLGRIWLVLAISV